MKGSDMKSDTIPTTKYVNNHIYLIPPTLDTLSSLKGSTNKISPQQGVGLIINCPLLLDITDDLSTIVPKFRVKFTSCSFMMSIPLVLYKPSPSPSSIVKNHGSKRTSFTPN